MPVKRKKLSTLMKKPPVKKRLSVKEESSPRVSSRLVPEPPMKRRKVKEQPEDDEVPKAVSTLTRRPARAARARTVARKEPASRGRGRPSRKTLAVKEERATSPKHKLVPKLCANRPFRKLRTQIGMPGDEQRVPTGAELTRLLGTEGASSQKPRDVAESSQVRSTSPRRAQEREVKKTSSKVTGGVVVSVHSKSEQGFDPDIPDACNMDCSWILQNFGSDKDQYFGVADGHGTNGQGAAKLVASQLPQYLHSTLEFPRDIPGAFKRAFKTTDEELRKSMNAKFSGSTAATLLIRGKKAYGAFVGDSRAFIARREKSWSIIKLSNDHTPEVPEETRRILAAGGRVHPHECELCGRHRVWLKTKDGPGLAMSRSFGDSVVARVGVISEPEIIEVDLQPADKFFILATDGVWDAMSNDAVVALVEPFIAKRDGQGAIDALIKEAKKRYLEDADRTDDTTVILGFLDVPE